MRKAANDFQWSYLFQMEDSTTPEHSMFARTFKSVLWVCMSIIMGMGVSQLT